MGLKNLMIKKGLHATKEERTRTQPVRTMRAGCSWESLFILLVENLQGKVSSGAPLIQVLLALIAPLIAPLL